MDGVTNFSYFGHPLSAQAGPQEVTGGDAAREVTGQPGLPATCARVAPDVTMQGTRTLRGLARLDLANYGRDEGDSSKSAPDPVRRGLKKYWDGYFRRLMEEARHGAGGGEIYDLFPDAGK